jgi:hypothetical protein
MYSLNIFKENKITYPPVFEYGINIPLKGKWINDWEWRYDFDDIFLNLKLDIKYWINKLLLKYLKAKNQHETYEYKSSVITINTDSLTDIIEETLGQSRLINLLYQRPLMLMIGYDIIDKFNKNLNEFDMYHTQISYNTEYQNTYGHRVMCVFSIPILFNPLAMGITLLPDYTKSCSYDMLTIIPDDLKNKRDLYRYSGQEKVIITKMFPQWDYNKNIIDTHVDFVIRNIR